MSEEQNRQRETERQKIKERQIAKKMVVSFICFATYHHSIIQ